MKTKENLQNNFSSESMAAIKYHAYAMKAEEEGFHQIAKLFTAMEKAQNIQAINTLKAMGELNDSQNNLMTIIDSKTYNYTQKYPSLIEQADLDVNPLASALFQNVVKTIKSHTRLLNEALKNFKRVKDYDYWVCGICGLIEMKNMPVVCKNCGASREKFIQVTNNKAI